MLGSQGIRLLPMCLKTACIYFRRPLAKLFTRFGVILMILTTVVVGNIQAMEKAERTEPVYSLARYVLTHHRLPDNAPAYTPAQARQKKAVDSIPAGINHFSGFPEDGSASGAESGSSDDSDQLCYQYNKLIKPVEKTLSEFDRLYNDRLLFFSHSLKRTDFPGVYLNCTANPFELYPASTDRIREKPAPFLADPSKALRFFYLDKWLFGLIHTETREGFLCPFTENETGLFLPDLQHCQGLHPYGTVLDAMTYSDSRVHIAFHQTGCQESWLVQIPLEFLSGSGSGSGFNPAAPASITEWDTPEVVSILPLDERPTDLIYQKDYYFISTESGIFRLSSKLTKDTLYTAGEREFFRAPILFRDNLIFYLSKPIDNKPDAQPWTRIVSLDINTGHIRLSDAHKSRWIEGSWYDDWNYRSFMVIDEYRDTLYEFLISIPGYNYVAEVVIKYQFNGRHWQQAGLFIPISTIYFNRLTEWVGTRRNAWLLYNPMDGEREVIFTGFFPNGRPFGIKADLMDGFEFEEIKYEKCLGWPETTFTISFDSSGKPSDSPASPLPPSEETPQSSSLPTGLSIPRGGIIILLALLM